jgi:hypothetical protein
MNRPAWANAGWKLASGTRREAVPLFVSAVWSAAALLPSRGRSSPVAVGQGSRSSSFATCRARGPRFCSRREPALSTRASGRCPSAALSRLTLDTLDLARIGGLIDRVVVSASLLRAPAWLPPGRGWRAAGPELPGSGRPSAERSAASVLRRGLAWRRGACRRR